MKIARQKRGHRQQKEWVDMLILPWFPARNNTCAKMCYTVYVTYGRQMGCNFFFVSLHTGFEYYLIATAATLAVWTPKTFFQPLTRPQGCQKITFFFLQMKLFSFCAKIASKRHKLQKPSKLKKKCQKNPVLLDIFEYSSNWGQS